jgi:hypothetical protein
MAALLIAPMRTPASDAIARARPRAAAAALAGLSTRLPASGLEV